MTPFNLSGSAIARRRAQDKRDGLRHLTHESGLCGMAVAACCTECFRDEAAELREWAKGLPAPHPGEDVCDYWRRVTSGCSDAVWCDAWYQVASERYAS